MFWNISETIKENTAEIMLALSVFALLLTLVCFSVGDDGWVAFAILTVLYSGGACVVRNARLRMKKPR